MQPIQRKLKLTYPLPKNALTPLHSFSGLVQGHFFWDFSMFERHSVKLVKWLVLLQKEAGFVISCISSQTRQLHKITPQRWNSKQIDHHNFFFFKDFISIMPKLWSISNFLPLNQVLTWVAAPHLNPPLTSAPPHCASRIFSCKHACFSRLAARPA